MNKFERINQARWDEVAPVHLKAYDLKALYEGRPVLDKITLREVGDVRGKRLLHLQCHIGSDTLSWALLGADVTGVDFSSKSLEVAAQLARQCGLEARWIVSDVAILSEKLNEQFDIVFATQGVLCWVSNLKMWVKSAADRIAPGGFLYLQDTHPALGMFTRKRPDYRLAYSYFGCSEPMNTGNADYADLQFKAENPAYEWSWTLGDIVNAVVGEGLKIEYLHEFDRLFYQEAPWLVPDGEGWWEHPRYKGRLPMAFSIKAMKPNL